MLLLKLISIVTIVIHIDAISIVSICIIKHYSEKAQLVTFLHKEEIEKKDLQLQSGDCGDDRAVSFMLPTKSTVELREPLLEQ